MACDKARGLLQIAEQGRRTDIPARNSGLVVEGVKPKRRV